MAKAFKATMTDKELDDTLGDFLDGATSVLTKESKLAHEQAASNTIKKMGGARKGAGRKRLNRTRLSATIKPETKAKLQTLAEQYGSIGEAIDQLV